MDCLQGKACRGQQNDCGSRFLRGVRGGDARDVSNARTVCAHFSGDGIKSEGSALEGRRGGGRCRRLGLRRLYRLWLGMPKGLYAVVFAGPMAISFPVLAWVFLVY